MENSKNAVKAQNKDKLDSKEFDALNLDDIEEEAKLFQQKPPK